MPSDVTREEFRALEREVEGEKLVTRHILEQTRRNGDDLATMRGEMKAMRGELKDLTRKVDGLDRKVDDLTTNLPRIVGDVVREVNSERDRKR
jgi:seryl-tRNA synthetase